jgi:hypothetical protein
LLDESHDSDVGEQFGDRADAIKRRRIRPHSASGICPSEALRPHHAAPVD